MSKSKYFDDIKDEVKVPETKTSETKSGYFNNIKNVVTNFIQPPQPEPSPIFRPNGMYEDIDVINLRNIKQVYKSGKVENVLFESFNFDIKDIKGEGQFVALLGKSGCGQCFSENTKITVRNKKTLNIEEISIKEFLKRFPQPE